MMTNKADKATTLAVSGKAVMEKVKPIHSLSQARKILS